jgi:pimeloyl-ACP methyl ester carboxylesterase
MVANVPLRLDRHRGPAPHHIICLPGLVPDGPEAWLRQRRLFSRHGSVAVASWSAMDFDLDTTIAALDDELAQARASGRRVILAAMSFGGGVALEWLRRRLECGEPADLAGLILVSPMGSIRDLSPVLTRLLDPIAAAVDGRGGDPCLALERGRSFFRQLAMRSIEDEALVGGWLGLLAALAPSAFVARHERRIRDRISAGIAALPALAAVQRVQGVRALRGLPEGRAVLCEAPTLILWGSKERHTLNMDGPCCGRLCRPDLACRVFPAAEVHWVYAADGGAVPHASTLRHAACFNRHLGRFLARLPRRGIPRQSIDLSTVFTLPTSADA